ncbi:hypothetical protein GTS_53150 [Gandjariella thermophila]|uniref:IPT/TIG domain-containing protein n=1 Tax=Gandjariella thermophila TaxID=1931992 RepID=A0A4D4JE43_9PSEU|nr:hypothetical protein GTS_53150 [Gandjariella thermophila]
MAAGVAVTPVAAVSPPARASVGTEDCIFPRPFFGPPTTEVTVSGCGFWPNEGIEVLFGGGAGDPRARTRANGKGEFVTKFLVPGDERAGARVLTAVGLSSKLFARSHFLVQNHP